MEQKSMTALVSAFARAYHAKHSAVPVFPDRVAEKLLTKAEYDGIASSMASGISFFCPGFSGSAEEALRYVADTYLSPSPVGRAAFAEEALQNAVASGATQYLLLAAGYDTFALRQPDWARALRIFELDLPATARDKRDRLRRAGLAIPENTHGIDADLAKDDWPIALLDDPAFSPDQTSFVSLLGLCYYMPKQAFAALLAAISRLVPPGSALVFDYPDEKSYTQEAGERAQKQALLAGGANEAMRASYAFSEMETLLSACGFFAKTHLVPDAITNRYFARHNEADPAHRMTAFDNVNYCLALRR